MELQTAINERRSIRKYDPEKKITKEEIETLIDAAIKAPSWKNSQTQRYYVVMSDDAKARFLEECMYERNRNNSADAAALIVTAFETGVSGFNVKEGVPDNELGNEWGAYDLGLANENLVLKAHEMGYGTLIMGLRDGDKIREFLSIPDSQRVCAVISVGVPAESPQGPKRKEVSEVAKFF